MASQKPWYEIKAKGAQPNAALQSSAEIYIYGDIGDSWDENSITAANFVRDLQLLNVQDIVLRINSLGGSVGDGLAIYNALKRHPAGIDVQVDGLAVSCASLIAMAGDTITMAENALMMIHAPWGGCYGNAAEMRDLADMLDKWAQAMATSYAAKTGKPADEMLALLTDGQDHWFTAAEAVAAGFADQSGPAMEISAKFDFTRFNNPAAAAAFTKEKTMPHAQTAAPVAAAPIQPAAAAPAAPVIAAGRSTEQNKEVMAMFKPFLNRDGVSALEKDVLANLSITVEAASTALLTHLGKNAEPATPQGAAPRVEMGADGRERFCADASTALTVRAGLDKEAIKTIKANPMRGHKLLDIARACLERAGVNMGGMSQMQIVAAAFTQSTSDFPVILENTMNKTLQAAYALQADTWRRFCAIGSVSDFRANNRYRAGSLSNLDALNELGEFKNKTIPDGEKASITASTKGNIINVSRQAIINDDLGAFIGLANAIGRAANRTIEADVYAEFALNSGKGPTMADGHPLFYSTHGNLVDTGSGAVPSVATIDAGRVAMAIQKDVSGNDYLALVPKIWIGPMSLGGSTRVINRSQYDPDTANKLQKPNAVANLFDDVIDTPRLTGNPWYMFANPAECPVFEVAFLDGMQEPYLELQNGFEVDGAQYKVRLDYGIAALDYKGAFCNIGA